MIPLLAILPLAFPQSNLLKVQGEVQVELSAISLSSQFWAHGMPIVLRMDMRPKAGAGGKLVSDKITPGTLRPLVMQGGKPIGAGSDKDFKLTGKGDFGEFAFEATLKKATPGEVEIYLEKPGVYKTGPLKLQILKEVGKADYDKVAVEQLEKTQAMLVTAEGPMLLELYPRKAPNTVRNFLKLSAKGFYNGTPFHRVVRDFMIQGGDPTGTGSGDPGYTLKAEFNDTKHVRGVISMARGGDPDSAGCQFFIVHGEHASHLDNQYTAFGKLIDGFDTLDKIATAPVGMNEGGEESKPLAPVVLKKVILVERPSTSAPAEPKKP